LRREEQSKEVSNLRKKLTLLVNPETKRYLRAVSKTLGYNSISYFIDFIGEYFYLGLLYDLKEKGFLTDEFLELLPESDRKLLAERTKELSKLFIERHGRGGSPPYSRRMKE